MQTYIEPDLKTAHLQIHNHFNPFSGLMNPIYILKSAKPVTKQEIKAVLKVCTLTSSCRAECCEQHSWTRPGHTDASCPPAAQSDHTQKTETETHDIYLVPPGEDTESCQSWIRMRNRDGRYNLMFEEWVTDGPFIISPRITFEVDVALGCWIRVCTVPIALRLSVPWGRRTGVLSQHATCATCC
jgi:uridine kinase